MKYRFTPFIVLCILLFGYGLSFFFIRDETRVGKLFGAIFVVLSVILFGSDRAMQLRKMEYKNLVIAQIVLLIIMSLITFLVYKKA